MKSYEVNKHRGQKVKKYKRIRFDLLLQQKGTFDGKRGMLSEIQYALILTTARCRVSNLKLTQHIKHSDTVQSGKICGIYI